MDNNKPVHISNSLWCNKRWPCREPCNEWADGWYLGLMVFDSDMVDDVFLSVQDDAGPCSFFRQDLSSLNGYWHACCKDEIGFRRVDCGGNTGLYPVCICPLNSSSSCSILCCSASQYSFTPVRSIWCDSVRLLPMKNASACLNEEYCASSIVSSSDRSSDIFYVFSLTLWQRAWNKKLEFWHM